MSLVSDRLLAAAFFISKENQPQNQPIEVLLEKVGASKINPPSENDWAWYCNWAGMNCDAVIHNKLSSHQLLIIYFSQSRFLDGIPDENSDLPLEKDGNLHIAIAFRDACETLKPEVAYIATHTYDAELDSIMKNADKIESYNANEIADDAGLLYLRGIIADCLTDPPPEYAPDTMPVSEGVLVFGGTGSKRWW